MPPEHVIFLCGDAAALDLADLGPRLRALGIEAVTRTSLDLADEALQGARGILLQAASLSGAQIDRAARCTVVVHAGCGPGGVDLGAARRNGVMVASVPDFATEELAAAAWREAEAWRSVQGGDLPARARPPRIGLVGLGAIGLDLAARAARAGLEVWGCDPFVHASVFEIHAIRRAALIDLLGICDLVSLQIPLRPASDGMIDAGAARLLRPGAWIINVGAPATLHPDASRSLREQGLLREIDPALTKAPAPRARALRMGLEVLADALKGRQPKHLLIDPPLPRLLVGAGAP